MAKRPKTADLMQDVFCVHPIGRSPQLNAGF